MNVAQFEKLWSSIMAIYFLYLDSNGHELRTLAMFNPIILSVAGIIDRYVC